MDIQESETTTVRSPDNVTIGYCDYFSISWQGHNIREALCWLCTNQLSYCLLPFPFVAFKDDVEFQIYLTEEILWFGHPLGKVFVPPKDALDSMTQQREGRKEGDGWDSRCGWTRKSPIPLHPRSNFMYLIQLDSASAWFLYRVVQLDFTTEILVFCMLFNRSLSIFTLTSF